MPETNREVFMRVMSIIKDDVTSNFEDGYDRFVDFTYQQYKRMPLDPVSEFDVVAFLYADEFIPRLMTLSYQKQGMIEGYIELSVAELLPDYFPSPNEIPQDSFAIQIKAIERGCAVMKKTNLITDWKNEGDQKFTIEPHPDYLFKIIEKKDSK